MELLTSQQTVPNQFPTINGGVAYRIALVGEAPGADEVVARKPFIGMSGRWLDYLLNRVGILRSACFLGNICQHRPPNNDITNFAWNDERIQNGLAQLDIDIKTFNPNIIVLLGGTALRAAKGLPDSITKWRGTLFNAASSSPFGGRKCIATFHPASSLRVYEQTPLLLFDLKRARIEGDTPTLILPKRNIRVLRTVEEVQFELERMRRQRRRIGTDIEGYVNNLTCISFADSPFDGYVVPFSGPGGNFWSEDDEVRVWQLVKELLEDPHVPKVLQNGMYDRFVLAYTYGIMIRGVSDDTMLKHWELYCELEKKLSLQASIYTKEPYYKDERDAEDFETHWTYNGKDSCVTLEICQVQGAQLNSKERLHYNFNMDLQNLILHLELRGLHYDKVKAKQTASEIKLQINTLQHALNKFVGRPTTITCEHDALTVMRDVLCVKRGANLVQTPADCFNHARKAFLDDGSISRAVQLCAQGYPFDDARNGEFSRLVGTALNTDSSKQLAEFLYTTLGLEPQFHKKTKQLTTDVLALLKLYKKTSNPVLKLILRLSSLLTQLQTLEILCDPDGRIRCSYNIVGSETGRLSCSKSPTRSGYNLQTVTKKQRGLFLPDPGYWLFQCDLSGADGWTVAAHSKRLGDPTMWDDLAYGLKPAKLIALAYLGEKVNQLPRETLLELSKQITDKKPTSWLYMGSKRVFHGDNYAMGDRTMSDQILQDSWKYGDDVVYVEPKVCGELRSLKASRYPGVQVWHRWVGEQLKQTRTLTTAGGQTRRFFGRPNDHDTLKQALAHEPQFNTTYATNKAGLNLWLDPANRRADGSLIIEPLHQVHDALVGQFPIDQTEWAVPRIRGYFANELIVAGERVVIPFEGHYGKSWAPEDLTNTI